jgi:hypothetical protein
MLRGAKAFDIQAEADQKMSATEQKLLQQQQKMRSALSSEREFYSREMGMCKHFIACSIMLYHCVHSSCLLTYFHFSDEQAQAADGETAIRG